MRRGDRLRHAKPRSTWVYAVVAGLCLIPTIVLIGLGASFGTAFPFAGLLVPYTALVLQERTPRKRSRRITLVGKSKDSPFSDNVLWGLRNGLTNEVPFELDGIEPPELHESGTLPFQVAELHKHKVLESDALVIMPAGDYPALWDELRSLTERGIFIVVVDVKAPNSVFYGSGLAMPRFVTSDFRRGGSQVGEFIASRLESGAADVALVLTGPDFSPPAMLRSRHMIYELLPFVRQDRVLTKALDSWDDEAAIHGFRELSQQLGVPKDTQRRNIVVFCGNDKNCIAIGEFLENNPDDFARDTYGLIGYDGVRDREQRLLVAKVSSAIATIDTSPLGQGQAAASFLADGYRGDGDRGHVVAHPKNQIIEPRLVRGPRWV